jgi:hypothetical protein
VLVVVLVGAEVAEQVLKVQQDLLEQLDQQDKRRIQAQQVKEVLQGLLVKQGLLV